MLPQGIQLSLYIGPAVPVPVSKDVIDALESVTVKSTTSGSSGFELHFRLSTKSPLQTIFLLTGGASLPLVRVVVVVTMNGTAETLIDGVMTNHSITAGGQDGHSTLTIIGEDLTRVMDYLDFSGLPYPCMPPEARVGLALLKYALFGVIPIVVPSVLLDIPIPTDRIPRQNGTDLAYIRQLADDVGYVFYVEPGPTPGTSFAYWGPEVKVGAPQPALNMDMDGQTNVESLNFTFNNENAKIPVLFIQESITKAPIPIPIPPITPLNPPLGAIPPIPKGIERITNTSKLSPIRAALVGLAKAAKTADALTANGSLDVLRYGKILKSRRLVGVRGAGPAFDGLYYVTGVTHSIKRGEYKQNFTLARNGLLSTVSTVPA